VVRRASRAGGPASAGPPALRRANHRSEEMRDEAPFTFTLRGIV